MGGPTIPGIGTPGQIIGASKQMVLLVTTLSSFSTPFMGSSTNVAIPSIGKEFAMDAVLLSWIATAYLLAAAMFLVPLGKIADIYGRKKLLLIGMLVFTTASLLCAVANGGGTLIAFRIVQGIGSAMIFGTSTALLTSAYPPQERGRALGINVAGVYTGLSMGPFVGGLLTQYFGWRGIFFAGALFGMVVIVAVVSSLRGEWAEARGEKLDVVGSVVYGTALAAIVYGLSLLPAVPGGALILIGLLGLLAFAKWESRVKNPVLTMALFRNNPVFAFSNLAALINYSATSAVGFLLSLYLQYIKGLSPQDAGLILVSQPVVMAVLSPFAGRASDRVEPRVVASTGMGLTVAGLVLFTLLDAQTSVPYVIAVQLLSGLAFALFSSPNTNAVMSSVEKRYYGVASATLATMRLTGQMLSMGFAMLIFALTMGRVQITPEYYPLFLTAVKTAFGIFAALCALGVFASLARGRVR